MAVPLPLGTSNGIKPGASAHQVTEVVKREGLLVLSDLP